MKQIKNEEFFNIYRHGFIRVALCVPEVKVADTFFNAESIICLAQEAAIRKAIFAVFPELSLSAYSNEDLFHQDALLRSVLKALSRVIETTKNINLILVIGAPQGRSAAGRPDEKGLRLSKPKD